MAYRGKYIPVNKDKYIGDWSKIRYLSLWELKLMRYLDGDKKVIRWNSEDLKVDYISPIDNKYHKYLVDFYVELRLPDGSIQSKMIEVKPLAECKPPKKGRNTARYRKALMTYAVNQAKWKAAKEVADRNGMKFQVLTEVELQP